MEECEEWMQEKVLDQDAQEIAGGSAQVEENTEEDFQMCDE
jgi:hypothetical protein